MMSLTVRGGRGTPRCIHRGRNACVRERALFAGNHFAPGDYTSLYYTNFVVRPKDGDRVVEPRWRGLLPGRRPEQASAFSPGVRAHHPLFSYCF